MHLICLSLLAKCRHAARLQSHSSLQLLLSTSTCPLFTLLPAVRCHTCPGWNQLLVSVANNKTISITMSHLAADADMLHIGRTSPRLVVATASSILGLLGQSRPQRSPSSEAQSVSQASLSSTDRAPFPQRAQIRYR